jgi:hypothetical protein
VSKFVISLDFLVLPIAIGMGQAKRTDKKTSFNLLLGAILSEAKDKAQEEIR